MAEHLSDASESRCDLLLSGRAVITMDDERRILEPGAVAITDDRISEAVAAVTMTIVKRLDLDLSILRRA